MKCNNPPFFFSCFFFSFSILICIYSYLNVNCVFCFSWLLMGSLCYLITSVPFPKVTLFSKYEDSCTILVIFAFGILGKSRYFFGADCWFLPRWQSWRHGGPQWGEFPLEEFLFLSVSYHNGFVLLEHTHSSWLLFITWKRWMDCSSWLLFMLVPHRYLVETCGADLHVDVLLR